LDFIINVKWPARILALIFNVTMTWWSIMLRVPLILTFAICLSANALWSQKTPEQTAVDFGTAIKSGDWSKAAQIMHPNALSQLRTLFEPIVSTPGGAQVAAQIFQINSAEEFKAAPDTLLFARLMKAVSAQQGMGDALRNSTITPLGHIAQAGDTVFVVSRVGLSVEGIDLTTFEVMPFLLYQGQYRALLKADFTNMAKMLRKQLGS
jgi:hypothetical protein